MCGDRVAAVIFEAVDFRHRLRRWYVHLLLLMPDHLHALVAFPRQEQMRKVVSQFKEVTTKRAGVGWQRDFFDHRLRTGESFEEKAHYIRMNPVRKGLIGNPDEWPWIWQPEHSNGGPSGPALPRR